LRVLPFKASSSQDRDVVAVCWDLRFVGGSPRDPHAGKSVVFPAFPTACARFAARRAVASPPPGGRALRARDASTRRFAPRTLRFNTALRASDAPLQHGASRLGRSASRWRFAPRTLRFKTALRACDAPLQDGTSRLGRSASRRHFAPRTLRFTTALRFTALRLGTSRFASTWHSTRALRAVERGERRMIATRYRCVGRPIVGGGYMYILAASGGLQCGLVAS